MEGMADSHRAWVGGRGPQGGHTAMRQHRGSTIGLIKIGWSPNSSHNYWCEFHRQCLTLPSYIVGRRRGPNRQKRTWYRCSNVRGCVHGVVGQLHHV
jgi:hypothetical protein